METSKIEISKTLINNIIDAYNKEYSYSITMADVESLILGIPFIKLSDKLDISKIL